MQHQRQQRKKSQNLSQTPVAGGGDMGPVRLNKYIADAGVCSRREADALIAGGKIAVDGKVVTELGFKVARDQKVAYNGKTLREGKPVYLLLNKPRGYITTTDDERERDTVMDLIKGATRERVYPVGRLDRTTSGLLLLTNDGDLAHHLTHPSHGVQKIYAVTLDKPLTRADFQRITEGVTLEDGLVPVDELAYASADDKREIGISIHLGRNRVVRRLFESLGYAVDKLDRVGLGLLTKRDLPRGTWRHLAPAEVRLLRQGASKRV